MSLAFLLALQATSSHADPDVRDFDLAKIGPAKGFEAKPGPAGCGEDQADEIIVCGSPGGGDRYRLGPLPPGFESEPLDVQSRLFGGFPARVVTESVAMPDGSISKRIMIRFTIPF